MNVDEIITEYEEQWRQAALDGTAQWRGVHNSGEGPCAALVAGRDLQMRAAGLHTERWWLCTCGFGGSLWGAMIHLNDAPHRWTWERFAKDFREAWFEGLKR